MLLFAVELPYEVFGLYEKNDWLAATVIEVPSTSTGAEQPESVRARITRHASTDPTLLELMHYFPLVDRKPAYASRPSD